MDNAEFTAWAILVSWLIISTASVSFAVNGIWVQKPIHNEAKADAAAIDETHPSWQVACSQVRLTKYLLRVQQFFLVHQSLFLFAALLSIGLRYFFPVDYSVFLNPVPFARFLRALVLPLDLVLAQAVIVLGQVALSKVGRTLRALYGWETTSISSVELGHMLDQKLGEAQEDRDAKAKEAKQTLKQEAEAVRGRLDSASSVVRVDAESVKQTLKEETEAVRSRLDTASKVIQKDAQSVKAKLAEARVQEQEDVRHLKSKLDAAEDLLREEAGALHSKLDAIGVDINRAISLIESDEQNRKDPR